MQAHTYSLKGILDSQTLDPNLCKLMLHQIKSPLLQHSFQVTTDDDRTDRQHASFILPDNHNQTYPSNRKNYPANKNRHSHIDSYSMTNSFYQTERKGILQQSNKQYSAQITNNNTMNMNEEIDKQLYAKISQSIVSPLQNHMFLQPQDNKNQQNQVQKFTSDMAKFCGQIFAPNLQLQNQVLIPYDPNHVRPGIFKKRQQRPQRSVSQSIMKPSKVYEKQRQTFTFNQCIDKLSSIEQTQLSNFIFFLSKCIPLLTSISQYIKKLQENSDTMSRILLQNTPVNYITKQSFSNQDRIKNRLNVSKFSELLYSLIKNQKSYNYIGNTNRTKQLVQNDMDKVIQILDQVQEIIQEYVSRRDTVNQLQIIHSLLYEDKYYQQKQRKSIKTPDSPIQNLKTQKNQTIKTHMDYIEPSYQANLKVRLNKLLYSLRVNEDYYEKLGCLRYIWPFIQQQNAYDNKQRFIEDLCRNDIVVKKVTKKNNRSFQKKLEAQGYVRNI